MIDLAKEIAENKFVAFLVGIQAPDSDPETAREHLDELYELVKTLGLEIAGDTTAVVRQAHAEYYLGSGKACEIAKLAREAGAGCIIMDHELSPSQQRNWEKMSSMAVIDRQEVIIDIFADRAITSEAVIQVELARLQYALPRLKRAWTHLSRQKGGAMGTRGEGEQQIEVDRRIVKQKIAHYQKELAKVKRHRETQRRQRTKNSALHAAIVGYTNAGKSSLLNVLCDSSVLVEDKLFATLDPTTRQMRLPNNQVILLTDTVGFVRKLPHSLVEAFKSTLEESVLADFIILVADISDRYVDDHIATTLNVLEELGAHGKEIITVFNKIDLNDDPVTCNLLRTRYPDSVFISVKTGEGLDALVNLLSAKSRRHTEIITVRLPPDRYDLVAFAHANGKVISSEYLDSGELKLTFSIRSALAEKYLEFIPAEQCRSAKKKSSDSCMTSGSQDIPLS